MPLGKFKAVLQQHFPSSFDARLPNHWDIRIRTPKPPFPHLRVFDNPLTIQEELRIEEAPFTDTRFFTFDGRIEPNTPPENPTDKIAFMNIIEKDIPVDVLEETDKLLRWKFDGKKLKGTFVVNRQLKQAFFEPGTTRESIIIHGRRIDPARFLEAWQFTDRYDALGILRPDPEDICRGHCEGTGWFPVNWDTADAGLRLLWVNAEIRRPQDDGWHFIRCPGCEGTGLNPEARKKRNKKGRKYEAGVSEQAMVWRVTYRSAVMFFKRKADAEEYATKFPSARIERVAAPSDVVVRGSEMEEASIGLSGAQPHPHPADEGHAHPGLPFAGAHDHATSFGYHRHRPGDPLDGAHLNMGAGQHDHLLAKGLTSYVAWSVEIHLKHPWVPGFVRAWIRHVRPGPEEKEFRIAGPSDWHEHTLWHMHSTGRSDPGAHASMFLDPEHRIIIKEYEMEDGTRRPATQGDFDAEEVWFRDNTPPELRQRLMEAGLESQDVPEAVQQPERAAEQATPGFESAKASDRALQKEWERLLSDQKAMGGTPEDALKGRAAVILKEIVKRGRANVRPRSPAEERLTAAGLKRFIHEGVVLPRQSARDLATGKATLALYPRENKCFLTFMLLIDGKKALGFIRHKAPKKVALVDVGKLRSRTGVGPGTAALRFEGLKTVVAYQVREFIPLPSPIAIENPAAADRIMPRVKLAESRVAEIFAADVEKIVAAKGGDTHTMSLSNLELVELHGRLHDEFSKASDARKEELVNEHGPVLSELLARGLEHRPKDELDQASIARVQPELVLGDVMGMFSSPILLKEPLMAIVGGVAVSGRGKDLDIWINWDPKDEEFLRVLKFRVKSMLPPDVNVHFITDAQGPFTNYIPLASLKVEFVPPDQREIISMSADASEAEDGQLAEQAPNCMPRAAAIRAKKPNPETFPNGKWRLFQHHRGASVHKDLRMKVNGFLRGWTITDTPAGAVKEGPESLKQLYDIRDRVKWKFRPSMDPATAVVAVPKARQSLIWLNVVNVIIEPGQVGATKNERGAFTLCDEGMFFEGMDKPVFKEFFFDGNVFKGRVTFRLISTTAFAKRAADPEETPKRALQWQLKTNLKDQVPTILGTRERRKPKDQQFVPAEGQMLIPPRPVPNVAVNARMIKEEFQWWAKGLRKATRLKRLDLAFNDLIEQGILTARKLKIEEADGNFWPGAARISDLVDLLAEEVGISVGEDMFREQERNFVLIKFFFKGPTVIRGLPFSFWALLFKREGKTHMIRFEDNVSPLQRIAADKGIAATRKDLTKREAPPGSDDTADWLTFPEDKEIPPAHPLNPNKRIPMFAERVDRGKLQIFTDRDIILTLQAKGADLKGNFVVRRGDPKQDVWTFERGVGPGEKRETTTKSEQSTFS